MNVQSLHFPSLILLLVSVLIAVGGQFLFKNGVLKLETSDGAFWQVLLNPSILFGLSAYFLSAILYVMSLKHIPLSIAYPTLALGYIVVVFGAYFFLDEALTLFKMFGVSFILLGVVMLWQ